MDATDLKMFAAVARLGGMGRAAAELNTVQSNVTAHVRRLEAELGTALFVRHARGVELTPAGRRLLPYAHRVARLLVDAGRAARDDGTPQGPLIIGSLETTAALRLTDALTTFAAAFPLVDLTLRTGTTCELIDLVLDHQIEGAFVCGPVAHPETESQTVFREELVLLTAPQVGSLGALAEQGNARIVVLRSGCSYRQRLEVVLARHGIPSPRVLEFGTLEAIFGCVAAGLGVTMLPRALVGPVWREGRVTMHTLPAEEACVETVFVRRRDGHFSSALAAFLDAAWPKPVPRAVGTAAA
ncbi:MAG TPA: LysR family transcriptional regulator [Acetobacteraceae bacterium]|nr:LysR family transcriptional regulator [Acetobacteraceae bacterium]